MTANNQPEVTTNIVSKTLKLLHIPPTPRRISQTGPKLNGDGVNFLVIAKEMTPSSPIRVCSSVSVRALRWTAVLGEAAGLAAALAVKESGDVREVDIEQLQDRLREYAVYLPTPSAGSAVG